MTLRTLYAVVAAVGFFGCVTFVTRYVVLSGGRWKDSEVGKFFVVVYTNLGALFLLILANTVFGDWPMRKWISLFLYVAFVAQTWWPIRLLNQAQRRNREHK